jgi:undecaprenyl-diphosphatase
MTLLYAVVLGLIQGFTEFLPISSTAHLTLMAKLFGLIDPQHPQAWTAFIAVMQLGTLAAVVVYFYPDIIRMTRSVVGDVRGRRALTYSDDSRSAICVAIGTVPIFFIGYFFQDFISGAFTKSTVVIIGSLVTLAVFLWIAEKTAAHVKPLQRVTVKDALLIGLAQACALIPGSSRSGITITAGLFLGLTREAAARFSFLLSIPAVLASGVHQMMHLDQNVVQLGLGNLIIATVVAALSGYAAIFWLLRYLSNNTTMIFVWYRLAIGVLFTLLLVLNVIQA